MRRELRMTYLCVHRTSHCPLSNGIIDGKRQLLFAQGHAFKPESGPCMLKCEGSGEVMSPNSSQTCKQHRHIYAPLRRGGGD
eukprot:1159205-Pelagomonas_calceolata.AAC.8